MEAVGCIIKMKDYVKLGPAWAYIIKLAELYNDKGYADFITKWPLSYYQKRVQQLGLIGLDSVLDVGCGYGQWVVALASFNKKIIGIDQNSNRISIAASLIQKLWVNNAEVKIGSAVPLDFPDASFDAVFCYGVFMFLDRRTALAEFHRVLRPGGKLYVCTNGRGWWLKLAISNCFKNKLLAKTAFLAFWSGRVKGVPNSTDLSDMGILSIAMWEDVKAAAEGELGFAPQTERTDSVYEAKYLWFDNVIEFTASKRISVINRAVVSNEISYSCAAIEPIFERILSASMSSYAEDLERYRFTDQPEDAVNATNQYAVERILNVTDNISRTEVLKYIYERVTNGIVGDRDKLIACIFFTQRSFYHHLGLQPMVGRDLMMQDPIASLLFGACRCGNSARFLIDLLLVNGFQARLLGGACHTTSEVLIDNRWVLADANLFPCGVIPLDSVGNILSLETVANNPRILDSWPSYINYNSMHIDAFRQEYPATYSGMERWVKFPIYPSVAYFGVDFSNDGTASMRRWEKTGDANLWEQDPDFGWSNLVELEITNGIKMPTYQRPGQVREIWRSGEDVVMWSAAETVDGADVDYTLIVSEVSRGWNYRSIPINCSFEHVGDTYKTGDTRIVLNEKFCYKQLYISIYAKDKRFPNAFVLPSNEFIINALAAE